MCAQKLGSTNNREFTFRVSHMSEIKLPYLFLLLLFSFWRRRRARVDVVSVCVCVIGPCVCHEYLTVNCIVFYTAPVFQQCYFQTGLFYSLYLHLTSSFSIIIIIIILLLCCCCCCCCFILFTAIILYFYYILLLYFWILFLWLSERTLIIKKK